MISYEFLSLDESGKASYSHPSDIFILSGVVIPEKMKSKLDLKMRKIKKKYFSDENLILHGRDMARKGGVFQSLKDSSKEYAFWSEFVSVVNWPEISFFFVATDKHNAQKRCWQPKTILSRSYIRILSEFAKHLKRSANCGRIINESEPEQDQLLIYAHNRLQAMGTGDGSVSGTEYKKIVTSLSLVNKSNHDIDIQVADVMAFVARLKYYKDVSKKQTKLNKVENMKYRLLERKFEDKTHTSLFEILI